MKLWSAAASFTVTGIVAISSSCMQQAQPLPEKHHVTSKDELVLFLDSLERSYEEACRATGLANWNSYAKEDRYDLGGAKALFAKIFSDTSARAIIAEWRGKSKSLADKLLARRLELWDRCFTGGAIYADPGIAGQENALQQKITNFAFTFEGKPTTRAKVDSMLRQEKSASRRHALWSVAEQLSKVCAGDLRSLVALRNEKARSLGFPNYYSLSLHLNATDEQWLVKTLNTLEEQTHDAFDEFISTSAKKLRLKEFTAWDFDFALREAVSLPDKYFPADSVFNVIHTFERGIGFPVDSLPIREVVKDIPYGGLSLAIRIPGDSRFLVNPTKGKGFYATAFHEYGHSLKGVSINVEYPILKGYEWVPGAQCAGYEEGVADMHGEFTDDSLWLETFTRAKTKEIDRYIRGRGIAALYRLRRLLKDFSIEYEMYRNPDQDMAAVERNMYARYLLVDVDSTESPHYASSIWYTSYPCYYQNYILAAMIATQLQEALSDKFGTEKISSPAVAPWMTEHLYAGGETLEWNDRIRSATGKQLEPGAYLRKLGLEVSHLITKE